MLLLMQLLNLLQGSGTDTTPDQFTFTDQTGVNLSSLIESNEITLVGFSATCNISVAGGDYSKNGAAYTSSAGTADLNDTIRVRGLSSGANSTAVNVVFTADSRSDTFTITTLAVQGPITSAAGRRRDGRNRGWVSRVFGGRG